MKRELIAKLHSDFEQLVETEAESGVEFWYARDLQELLGYAKWENFLKVINKARSSCVHAGYEVSDHFLDVRKMVDIGSGAQREIEESCRSSFLALRTRRKSNGALNRSRRSCQSV